MQISDSQTDKASLAKFGVEALRLIHSGRFTELAHCFGYALAFDREPSLAIEEDLATCLADLDTTGFEPLTEDPELSVQYFERNETGLLGVVVGELPAMGGRKILVELIVSSRGNDMYLTLEQISPRRASLDPLL